ncbi:MAG TPA: hypothetical protein VEB22_06135 [Phycisphaerales bacterium]|nr:hypothetical protein [Phycisphaerales bacterium]
MAVTQKLLRRLQIGQETTKGTEVNATKVLIVNDIAFDLAPTIYHPSQDLGILADRDMGVETARHVNWSANGDLSFEEAIYWFNMALKKVTLPTGAMADKTWTFTPAAAGSDDFMTYTMETRHSDGTNNIDRTMTYGMCTSLELSASLDQQVTLKAEGFVKNEASTAITAALTIPTTFTILASQDFKLYSDPNWAGLGTTQITGQVYGFTWKLMTGLAPAFYLDGAKTMTRHRRVRRAVELTLQLDQEASSGLAETMRSRLTSRASSFIQLEALGAVLGAGNYKIELDGHYAVDSVGPPTDHEGEDAVTVRLRSKYDPTGAQDVRAVVVNASATLV